MPARRGHVDTNRLLGFGKDEFGKLVVIPSQAVVVRTIFQLYLDGISAYRIAQVLDQLCTPTYTNQLWNYQRIVSIILNEKYMGACLMQKSFIDENGRQVPNRGQRDQYWVEDDHPAIIDRDTWALVQLEMTRQEQFVKTHSMDKFHHHSGAIPLSGKIVCQACGHTLVLRESFRKADYGQKYWRCKNFLAGRYRPVGPEACPNGNRIDQEFMDRALVKAWNELVSKRTCPSTEENSKLISYRQARMKAFLEEYGSIETMPYDLILKVLDHVEAHADNLNVIFLSGNTVRVELPKLPKPHPRWTHTRKAKTPMARRRMDLGLTQVKTG